MGAVGSGRMTQCSPGNHLPRQETQETRVQSLGQESPWTWKWPLTPVFLPGKFHGQGSLVGYSPWDHKEPNTTDHILMCTTERNSKPVSAKILLIFNVKKTLVGFLKIKTKTNHLAGNLC